jgi:hypothetical protein
MSTKRARDIRAVMGGAQAAAGTTNSHKSFERGEVVMKDNKKYVIRRNFGDGTGDWCEYFDDRGMGPIGGFVRFTSDVVRTGETFDYEEFIDRDW